VDAPTAAAAGRYSGIARVLLVAAVGVAYVPVLAHGVDVWRSDAELSFGFLVPPVVAVLTFLHRGQLRSARAAGRGSGLALLIAGLVLLVASARSGVHALAGVSVLPVAVGGAAYLYGLGVARLLTFPAALLAGGLSLYRGLLSPLGFALQQVTAQAAAAAAGLAGVPVRRSGVDLFTGHVHLVVAEACSGMDSLLALLCLGALFVGLTRASIVRRAALVGLVLPIIVVANVLRVTLVLVLAWPLGAAVAGSALHDLLSAILFVAATLLFLATGFALRCVPSLPARAWSPS